MGRDYDGSAEGFYRRKELGVPPGSASSTGIGGREWEEAVGAGGVLQKSG